MKTIFATIFSIGLIGICLGQGTVNWLNISPTAITAQTNSAQYSPLIGGGANFGGVTGNTAPANSGLKYYYELLYNTSFTGSQIQGASAPSNSFAALFGGGWLDTGLTRTNSLSNPGGFLVPVNPNSAAVVPWANGATNNIVLVGWSANLGTSWATVSNILVNFLWPIIPSYTFFGVSATGYINPGTVNPGVAPFGSAAQTYGLPIDNPNMQLYLLPVAPEPGVLALAGLGGLALFLFRRRR